MTSDHSEQRFDQGMRYSSAYRLRTKDTEWKILQNLYGDFLENNFKVPRIPRIIHQIWLGSSVPSHYLKFTNALKQLHPGWQYHLWHDQNLPFKLENEALFLAVNNPGQKSDILRYEILRHFGGVYLDMDFVAIRPLDSLLGLDFFAGVLYDSAPQLANGLMGSSPGNPLICALCKLTAPEGRADAMTILETTGPGYLTRRFFEHHEKLDAVAGLPNSYFYPYPNFPKDRVLGDNYQSYLSDESLCCHLWHCSWLKKPAARKSMLGRMKKFLTG